MVLGSAAGRFRRTLHAEEPMRWFWALTLTSLVLAACGGTDETGTGGGPDGPRAIPDGFVQQNCVTNNDCDDGNPCTLDACPVASRVCEHTPKDCTALKDDCNDGVCDATSGDCAARPLADDTVCSAAQSMPGTCQIGVCIAQPQCYTSYSLGTYACATGLDGPERAYPINVPTDRDITLSLTDTAGDFDLLVLEGEFCVSNAKCAASSVTAGTGNETLTFHATGGKDYLIVIESKPGVTGSYTLNITCVGGTCKPI